MLASTRTFQSSHADTGQCQIRVGYIGRRFADRWLGEGAPLGALVGLDGECKHVICASAGRLTDDTEAVDRPTSEFELTTLS